ncbi:hypothetical protein D918_04932 [Trichuris suis]|nr:hypothetical protein D918_04932 [Trichuris suis]
MSCLDKCEIELILQWTSRWIREISGEQKIGQDGKKSKKNSKSGWFK